MENKKMFDQIINEMNGGNETNPNTNDDTFDPTAVGMDYIDAEKYVDDSIMLTMSTGETYLVDVASFDWDGGVKNLSKMIENENSLINIMFTLLRITDPNTEENAKTIESIVEQVDNFMDGFHIHSMNPTGSANIRQLLTHYNYNEILNF